MQRESMITYRIHAWQRDHENNRSRELDQPRYSLVPNKQDGMGLTAILAEPDGSAIYGIWCLIVGALSKQHKPRDGWLTDDGTESGTPMRFDRMALRWRRTPKEVKRAVEFLASDQVGWLEVTGEPQQPATEPATDRSGADRSGVEGTTAPAGPTPARLVFDHWVKVMGKDKSTKFLPTTRRYKAVLARFKDGFSVDQLCRAVDGCKLTPHNMGQNDRQTLYNDLELICRTVENVEKFIERSSNPAPEPSAPLSTDQRRQAEQEERDRIRAATPDRPDTPEEIAEAAAARARIKEMRAAGLLVPASSLPPLKAAGRYHEPKSAEEQKNDAKAAGHLP